MGLYCGQECQKTHWPEHRGHCNAVHEANKWHGTKPELRKDRLHRIITVEPVRPASFFDLLNSSNLFLVVPTTCLLEKVTEYHLPCPMVVRTPDGGTFVEWQPNTPTHVHKTGFVIAPERIKEIPTRQQWIDDMLYLGEFRSHMLGVDHMIAYAIASMCFTSKLRRPDKALWKAAKVLHATSPGLELSSALQLQTLATQTKHRPTARLILDLAKSLRRTYGGTLCATKVQTAQTALGNLEKALVKKHIDVHIEMQSLKTFWEHPRTPDFEALLELRDVHLRMHRRLMKDDSWQQYMRAAGHVLPVLVGEITKGFDQGAMPF